MNTNVTTYLKLVAAYIATPSEANVDAVEAFETANPSVIDEAYVAAGPLSYDLLTGSVVSK